MTHAARITVIGAAGWAGSRHVQAFHALGASVVALVDPIPQVRTFALAVGAEVLDSGWVASSDIISVSVRSAARKLAAESWRAAPDGGG
jgi:hypothetical protein